jgi:hypothetical protein
MERVMGEQSETWAIRAHGYGTFVFVGTEAEAEQLRMDKARWDRGSSLKWRLTNQRESDRITARIAAEFDAGKGVPRRMFSKRNAALQAEGQQP